MKLNVLSLFDGMSCGQQALERCGIEIENYYASEIDKYAIQVTMANYPNTIQLGSVVGVDGYKLPKIDLLIGGSPCQSFSFAGKRKGMATKCETEILTLEHYLELKAEGYEFEGQSYLFWEFMRLLNETKPKYFLLENVEMGEKWEKVLSKSIGVNGIHINSALVSAQNRKRIYWTNIGMQSGGLFGDLESIIQQPKDKGILLKDILESDVDEKYFLSEKMVNGFLAHNKRHIEEKNQTGFNWKPTIGNKKGNTLRANAALCPTDNSVIVYNNKRLNETIEKHKNQLSHNTLIDSYNKEIHKDKSITISTRVNASSCTHIYTEGELQGIGVMITNLNENQQKKFNPNINSDKANALTLAQGRAGSSSEYMDAVSKIANITSRIRRLTPIECERLQTVKDNYTNHVSDSQRYKMLGNGWTIDVIAHIFNYLK
jgi:DNA (cytosine-5)-methyltransferase 3A